MSVRTRRARKHSRTHIIGFGLAGVLGFIALLFIALAVSVGTLVDSWLQDLPDYNSADAYLVSEPTQVYDANNNVIAEYYLQNRRSVTKDQVSPYVLEGTVDTEDVRFYQHNGVDPQGIVRAVLVTFRGGSEGASTITQQLVRNTVLSDEQFEQTLKRKVREAYIAIQMEKTYSKEQILMMYLNTIYYGHSAYGIQAASITYFNKDAKDLTLAEAALLVGLPQSPSYYDPTENPEAAIQRRNTVLDRMLTAGDITQEEHDEAQSEPLTLNQGQVIDPQGTYPYFTDYVKSLLLQDFDQDTVFQGGLKVYTTLDPNMQEAAQDAVENRLSSFGNAELDSALVAVEPGTGYIKAMVGGRDYSSNQYNLATQAERQPGSSFKAFTLVAALRAGMSPDIYINANSPMQITSTWKVQNFGNYSYGTITLREATARSSNTAYGQVAVAIGADSIVQAAKDMGVDVDLPSYPSITLGTTGVPPIQMAEAYATLATGGVHRDTVAITKIEDRNGNTVYEHEDNPEQTVDPAVAQTATDVLEGVITSGNGTANVVNGMLGINQPVAGKTGTSEDYRDLWFVGYSPQLSVAVWCGYRQEATVYIHGTYGHPYTTSCLIWADFMNSALEGVDRQEFPKTDEKIDYKSSSSFNLKNTYISDNSGTQSSTTYGNESSGTTGSEDGSYSSGYGNSGNSGNSGSYGSSSGYGNSGSYGSGNGTYGSNGYGTESSGNYGEGSGTGGGYGTGSGTGTGTGTGSTGTGY
ncbi:PBP1A family penicillin-binding protein [Olsenella sp. YH-ols2223]|uniref:PBP1A family penicillin-binding protein n=1 Tax=Olsenella absiana TaxID=3115222 RepID=A0ABU7R9X3_9ACTN